MSVRVGINGFGRIGRSVFRIIAERDDVEVVAINDLFDNDQLVYLLKYDSVMRLFAREVSADDDYLYLEGRKIAMTAERDPAAIPWGDLGVEVVVESTGVFTKKDQLAKHLVGGAGKVILTVPPKDEIDAMIVIGVNDDTLKPEHRLVSNASCTTNCLAPVVKVIHEHLGIRHGSITTIHDLTNTQSLLDQPHKDLRRARASLMSLIPTTTGSATAIAEIFPELRGRLNGHAVRVPLANASLTDCVFEVERATTVEEVNQLLKAAANGELKGILGFEERPLVSIDYRTDPRSSIIDALSTLVVNGTQVKLYAWYDNEWGYANRAVELARMVGQAS